MFYFLSKTLLFLINPICWLLVLNLYLLKTKSAKRRKLCILASMCILLFFSSELVLNKILIAWEEEPMSIEKIEGSYDFAIVLTGSLGRIKPAIELYERNKVKNICIIGHPGYTDFVSHLIKSGIPEENIFVENKSKNTYKSALNFPKFFASISPTFLGSNKIIMITSALHMKRAKLCFEKQNIKFDTYATQYLSYRNTPFSAMDLLPTGRAIAKWEKLLKEWVGILTYKLMGYA